MILIRKNLLDIKDERAKAISEYFTGIKIIKVIKNLKKI